MKYQHVLFLHLKNDNKSKGVIAGHQCRDTKSSGSLQSKNLTVFVLGFRIKSIKVFGVASWLPGLVICKTKTNIIINDMTSSNH